MRVMLFSLLLILCVLFVAHGAPLDSRSPKAKALSTSKAAAKKAPAVKISKVKPVKSVKPVTKVKTATKAKPPSKVKPATKAKPASKAKSATKAKTVTKPKTSKKTPVTSKTKPINAGTKAQSAKTKATKTAKATGAAAAKVCSLKKRVKIGKNEAPTDDKDCNPCLEPDLSGPHGCIPCASLVDQCGFDLTKQTCVQLLPNAPDSNLITNSEKCSTEEKQAEKIAASAPPPPESPFKPAAVTFFNDVRAHVFAGPKGNSKSGRHLLSVWVKSNKDTEILDDSNKDTTGIVTFKNGATHKTVWNDQSATGAKVYREADVEAMCVDAFIFSLAANSGNKANLPSSTGKAALKLKLKTIPRDEAGFVVANPVTGAGQNLCVHVDKATCFPLAVKATTRPLGTECKGTDKEEE